MPIHPAAPEGFGRAAPASERWRPGYPQAAIGGIVRPYREGAPSHERDGWREVMRTTTAFVPVAERQFSHRQLVDADGLVDRVVSISFIATLKESERELVAERIRRLATG